MENKYHLAYVHRDAKIGKNVTIEPFSYIAGDVEIGDGCHIGPNATVLDGARLGKNVRVMPTAVISGIPQDLKFAGEYTTTHIGDNTTVREAVTVNRGTVAKNKTIVGKNCLLMAYSHIAHDVVIGNNCIIGNTVQVAGEVEIDDFAIVSAGSLIHQFVKVGAHVMVAGGSLLRKDVPPYVKAAREPLSYVGINSIGLRRRNFSDEAIRSIQEAYRYVFLENYNTTQAIKLIETNIAETPERNTILEFLRRADRGIIKGYSNE